MAESPAGVLLRGSLTRHFDSNSIITITIVLSLCFCFPFLVFRFFSSHFCSFDMLTLVAALFASSSIIHVANAHVGAWGPGSSHRLFKHVCCSNRHAGMYCRNGPQSVLHISGLDIGLLIILGPMIIPMLLLLPSRCGKKLGMTSGSTAMFVPILRVTCS